MFPQLKPTLLLAVVLAGCYRSSPLDPESPGDSSMSPILSSCGDTSGLMSGAPWPMRGQCPSHEARSAFVGPQTAKLKWSFAVQQPVGSSPAISADGSVFFGTEGGGTFYSLDGMTSRVKWSRSLVGTVISDRKSVV